MELESRKDWAGLLVAAFIAVLPLFPYGARYLGAGGVAYFDAVFLLAAALWVGSRLALRRRGSTAVKRPELRPAQRIAPSWLAFIVAATVATIAALAAENHLLFRPAQGALQGLFAQQVPGASAWYPARLWLTFVEGFLAFSIVKSFCARGGARRRRPDMVLWGWLAGVAIVSSFAIFQYVARFQLHPYWTRVNPNLVRSNSTLDDPNALAAYLLLGIGVALGMAWSVRHESTTRFRIAALFGLLGLLALLTTVSRSAIGAFLIVATAALAFGPPRFFGANRVVRWGARAALLALVGVLAVSVLMRGTVEERAGYSPEGPTQAWVQTLDPRVPVADVLEHRQTWWSGALQMFAEHPLLGVGLGRFPELLLEYEPDAPVRENAHNLPLQVLAEMGILGLLLLAMLASTIVAGLTRAAAGTDRRSAALATGMLIGAAAFGMTQLSGNALLLSSIQVLFAIPLAAVTVAAMDAQRLSLDAPRAAVDLTMDAIIGDAAVDAEGWLGPAVAARVGVVIVHYPSAEDVEECVGALAGAGEIVAGIVVVDNASPDSLSQRVCCAEGVEVLRCEANVGFARAANLGARRAGGDLLLFLNPDVRLRPSELAGLVETIRGEPTIGAVAPNLLGFDGTSQVGAAGYLPTVRSVSAHSFLLPDWLPGGFDKPFMLRFDGVDPVPTNHVAVDPVPTNHVAVDPAPTNHVAVDADRAGRVAVDPDRRCGAAMGPDRAGRTVFEPDRTRRDRRGLQQLVSVDWVSGACMLVRRSAFEQVGGFDECFFLYGEDIDLGRRLHEAGWQIVLQRDIAVRHLHCPNEEPKRRAPMTAWIDGLDDYYRQHAPRSRRVLHAIGGVGLLGRAGLRGLEAALPGSSPQAGEAARRLLSYARRSIELSLLPRG